MGTCKLLCRLRAMLKAHRAVAENIAEVDNLCIMNTFMQAILVRSGSLNCHYVLPRVDLGFSQPVDRPRGACEALGFVSLTRSIQTRRGEILVVPEISRLATTRDPPRSGRIGSYLTPPAIKPSLFNSTWNEKHDIVSCLLLVHIAVDSHYS